MPIAISCRHCDWKGSVKDELAGKSGKCPTCGELIPIPTTSSPPTSASNRPATGERSDAKDRPRAARGDRDDDDRPRRRRYDDDDRPSRARRRPDDDDDRAVRGRRGDDEYDDERPPSRRRRVADDYDDDRPRSRRRDYDDDEYDDRRRRGRRTRDERREADDSSKKIWQIVGGIFLLLLGIGLFGLSVLVGKMNYWAIAPIVIGILTLGQGLKRSSS